MEDPIKKEDPDQEASSNSKSIITQENNLGNIDAWITGREEFMAKVATAMKETKDYHIIQGKKSLAKGGAEKIASIFKWTSTFVKDVETYEMFGSTPGLIVYKCILKKANKLVGEGRGASSLQKNAGDPNKTIKMAQKSAYIDAVIRTSGLSDIFTQDLEDMPPSAFSKPAYTAPVSAPRPIQQPTTPARAAEIMQGEVVKEPDGTRYKTLAAMIGSAKSMDELNQIPKVIETMRKGLSDVDLNALRKEFSAKKQTLEVKV